MLKVMTIVGTRPEILKMSRVIAEFDKHTNHVLVHTGQNYDYELNQIFFDELEIRRPDHFLEAAGATAAKTIANVIDKSDTILQQEKPDAVLLYGDTNSCLSAIAAKRLKIPVFHMEAGNRCFDQRVPEELNRKIVDHISDINMVLTEHARRYLIAEGLPSERIIKTGSHMEEVLRYYLPKIMESKVLEELGVEAQKYFLVSAHREENVDEPKNLKNLLDSLQMLVDEYDMPIFISTHPRTKDRLGKLGFEKKYSEKLHFLKPFGFLSYVKLQMNAFCTLSDSGTIAEESSLLNFPAITPRNSHERPEGMDEGTLIMSGLNPSRIVDAVRTVTEQQKRMGHERKIVGDYQAGPVSVKVLRIVKSYTDYINRVVWFKGLE